jgi:hypothetical protein
MNRHDIHIEHDPGHEDLLVLAELDEDAPIAAPALVSRVDGEAVAALSLVDGRAVANPFRHTAMIVTMLELQANAMRTVERKPSRRARIMLRPRRSGSGLAPTPA